MRSAGEAPGRGAGGGERLPPFYCPYCGEEDLRPAGPDGGDWRCGACARTFRLRLATGRDATRRDATRRDATGRDATGDRGPAAQGFVIGAS